MPQHHSWGNLSGDATAQLGKPTAAGALVQFQQPVKPRTQTLLIENPHNLLQTDVS